MESNLQQVFLGDPFGKKRIKGISVSVLDEDYRYDLCWLALVRLQHTGITIYAPPNGAYCNLVENDLQGCYGLDWFKLW